MEKQYIGLKYIFTLLFLFLYVISYAHELSKKTNHPSSTDNRYLLFSSENTIDIIGTNFKINKHIDLKGKTIVVPANCTLQFENGSISNGAIIGNNTKITANTENIFKNIIIKGSWKLNIIYSKWFDFKQDKSDNIINFRNMMTLAKSDILTHIYIEEGEFYTSTWQTDESNEYIKTGGIIVPSNVYIHNKATIKEIANPYEKTSMFYLENVNNITIDGGKLIGDVRTHLGTKGEWGIGIYPIGSKNVTIKNIEICEFWGDGIDVQSLYSDYINKSTEGHCENIIIDNVICKNNRRQGISIEAVKGITIKNSEFSGTGSIQYTAPGAGINIEPWHNAQIVTNIRIENCKIYNNKFAILYIPRKQKESYTVILNNITTDGTLWLKGGNVKVDNFKGDSFLCIWNKAHNIHIKNSYFGNELFCNGDLENVIIDNCYFDMSSNPWSGFGITFQSGRFNRYQNIRISNSSFKTNNKLRAISVQTQEAKIDFINNYIESNAPYEFSLGYGNFIGNVLVLKKRTDIHCKNITRNTIKIQKNHFYGQKMTNSLLNFKDATSITNKNIKFDYEISNNKFYISSFTKLLGGNANSLKIKINNNDFQ